MEYLPRAENHQFTYSYSQPDDYHFCQDSVIFPKFVAENFLESVVAPGFQVLDVCSGCGVIGLELSFYRPDLRVIDFLEVQTVYEPHFVENLRRVRKENSVQTEGFGHEATAATLNSAQAFRFLNKNYSCLLGDEFANTYDLILTNPPYFDSEDSLFSPSEIRNRSRFFIDSDLKTLVLGVVNALKSGGQAFLLMKLNTTHGRRRLRDLRLWLGSSAQESVVADMRGTAIVRIVRE